MVIERYYLERALVYRVPGVRKINSASEEPFVIVLYIGDERGEISDQLLEMARQVIEEIRPVGIRVAVRPYTEGPGDAVPPVSLPEEIRKAAVLTPPTKSEIELLLKNVVDGCLFAEAVTVAGGEINVYVGDKDKKATKKMLDETHRLLKSLYGSTVKYTICEYSSYVEPEEKSYKNMSVFFTTSRFDPARYKDEGLRKLAKEDEERFCDNLPRLIEGDADYEKDLGCNIPEIGSALVDLLSSEKDLEIFLTLYPRVYLYIRQDNEEFAIERKNHGSAKLDILLHLTKKGRIIPVFHAPLYQYSPRTVMAFLEESEGRAILPRQLDGLTVLTMARQFPFWKTFRQAPETAAEIYYLLNYGFNELKGINEGESFLIDIIKRVFEHHLMVAERGEQWFLDKGHLAASTLTAGGIVDSFFSNPNLAKNVEKEKLDTIILESHVYSMNLTAARALGAVYSPTMVLNEPVMNMVAHLQAGPRGKVSVLSGNHLDTILQGLHIIRPEHVPVEEYLEVINSTEAERLRRIVLDMVYRSSGNIDKIKEEIERFNREVAKWRKSKIKWVSELIDIEGLMLDLVPVPTGKLATTAAISFFGMALKALIGKLTERTVLAEIEDRIFGAIGGVSPAAVRISKIRSKIGSIY